jgi:AraC-like DNA-binding protein
MTEAKTIIDAHGAMWVATNDGIITFKPEEMKKSAFKPNIIFTSLQYQGEQQQQPLIHCRQLNIEKPSQRNLTINFAALDYNDNYLIRYAYRIDDGDWSEIGSNSRITFNQLPPGQHSLVVKSTNADGIWVDNDTELIINVEPTLMELTWFRLLLLLLVIGLSSWAVIRYMAHRRHTREREQRLQHVLHQYSELQEQLLQKELSENSESSESSEYSENSDHSDNSENPPSPTMVYKLDEPEIVNPDEEMMDKLMKFIEQHISDEDLKIEDMADAVSLGRSVFYGKIKSLVGVSPSDFLRQIRMERAIQLITKSKYSFSEIAYSCGFSDPKYFSKCFKKETGMTPTEYRQQREQS